MSLRAPPRRLRITHRAHACPVCLRAPLSLFESNRLLSRLDSYTHWENETHLAERDERQEETLGEVGEVRNEERTERGTEI
jgi:hypothetical protein